MADPRGVGGGLVPLSTIPQDPAAAAAAAARGGESGWRRAPGGAPPRAGGRRVAGRGRGAGGPRMFNGAEVTDW
jgi:hypothetical protein